jgi:predicted RNA methylase
MTKPRAADFELVRAILDPGFTPRVRDAEALLDLLEAGGSSAASAERALVRLGAAARAAAARRVKRAGPRVPTVRLLGKLGAMEPDPELCAALVLALGDHDEPVRRAAATALGKLRPLEAGAALSSALARETVAASRRAMIEALGKVGGEAAHAAITAEGARGDPAVARETERAAVRIERTSMRDPSSSVDLGRSPKQPTAIVLRCRKGLEPILLEEVPGELGARIATGGLLGARVEGTLRGPLDSLFAARTWLSLGFPLPPRPSGEDLAEAVVAALTSPPAISILRRFTVGPLRYRVAFRAGGKRRAVVWRVAAEVQRHAPDLVNDPVASPWEVVVHEARGALALELVPNLPDARFAYRTGDVPAASHPTIAAALVRAAGGRDGDVVWDPFAGSGTELCERALAGGCATLVGSDVDPRALAVAKANLEACGAHNVTLVVGDAASLRPPGPAPTLIVTNPPLGRRVQRTAALAPMLDRFLAHAADVLAPGGRLAWISPFPQRTRAAAAKAGLSLARAFAVDLGGFEAELQVFVAGMSRARQSATRSG